MRNIRKALELGRKAQALLVHRYEVKFSDTAKATAARDALAKIDAAIRTLDEYDAAHGDDTETQRSSSGARSDEKEESDEEFARQIDEANRDWRGAQEQQDACDRKFEELADLFQLSPQSRPSTLGWFRSGWDAALTQSRRET